MAKEEAPKILLAIEQTARLIKQHTQQAFEQLGLDITVEQWGLLNVIHSSERLSQRELADKTLKDPASITRMLDLLQAKTLVQREPIPGNRRQFQLSLTRQGQALIKTHQSFVTRIRTQSMSGFSHKELEQFGELLDRVQANLSLL